MSRIYPSKLILFGEYSVVLGSQVLGMPMYNRYGYWSAQFEPNSVMKRGFMPYLIEHCQDFLDLDKLEEVQAQKVYYGSTIKRGYGTGSSGALSAAIYDHCRKLEPDDLESLQHQLALIESFFHGTSSGFDPLISYINSPILRTYQGKYTKCVLDDSLHNGDYKLYLLDSGQKRTARGLVSRFVEWHHGSPDIYAQLVTINNELIDSFLAGDELHGLLKKLSSFQYEQMKPMILDKLIDYWEEGLETGRYYMKICGTGGGGYYMVYSADPYIMDIFEGFQLVPIDLS